MIITDRTWARIRERFTEEDKQKLRDAYLGEVICPKGIVIDEANLDSDLAARVAGAKGSW